MENILKMSYMYYSVVGSIITIFVGCVVSSCFNNDSNTQVVHPIFMRSQVRKGHLDYLNGAQKTEPTSSNPGKIDETNVCSFVQ